MILLSGLDSLHSPVPAVPQGQTPLGWQRGHGNVPSLLASGTDKRIQNIPTSFSTISHLPMSFPPSCSKALPLLQSNPKRSVLCAQIVLSSSGPVKTLLSISIQVRIQSHANHVVLIQMSLKFIETLDHVTRILKVRPTL